MTHVPWHEMANDGSTEPNDSKEILSVGIDIGTTTTHLMLSSLTTRQSRMQVEKRGVVQRAEKYRSPVILTPLQNGRIDTTKLESFIDQSYRTAGYEPTDISTGAVIITGEARRADNAEDVVSHFSDRAGDFVCAMAGPNLEAVMSAHGSGAVDYSVDTESDVLHIDIGGGTTEFALIREGFVEETASARIGARLIELTEDGEVLEVRDPVLSMVDDLPFEVERGAVLTNEQRRQLAEVFARRIFDIIEGRRTDDLEHVLATEFPTFASFDSVTCSGGVSEYLYGRSPGFYNDLGPELGSAIRRQLEIGGYALEKSATSIRATVAGSTQHSVQISGRTITVTDDTVLPLKNIPMIPFVADAHSDPDELTDHLIEQLQFYDVPTLDSPFAFGFHLHGRPTYDFLDRLVTAIVESWNHIDGEQPLVLVSDFDIGKSVGDLVASRIDSPVIAVDNIELDQFGYLDISDVKEETGAPLVTVKSLVF